MGGMNLFFVFGSGASARLLPPKLTGTLLPGITRDALLSVGKDLGYEVEEGRISVEEWRGGCSDGGLPQVFPRRAPPGLTPGRAGKYADRSWRGGDGKTRGLTTRLSHAV